MPESMPETYIVISGYGSISPLGFSPEMVAESYRKGLPVFQYQELKGKLTATGALLEDAETQLKLLYKEKREFKSLDRSVLMGIYASRQAVAAAGWPTSEAEVGINLGSSRGAANLLEHDWEEFRQKGTVKTQSSPTTTLGNVSSWVAQDLQASGPVISQSVTCSTALQALANGVAWLKAGMAEKFLAGGTEAPLTPFTIAQMKALGIYAGASESEPFPCRPHNPEKRNTFVLGEGAAVFALEKLPFSELKNQKNESVILEGIGFGVEPIKSKTSISADGLHFQKAIRNALKSTDSDEPIDLVIMHAPGTAAGDAAEMKALEQIFGKNNIPPVTNNKFLIGHTLGASGALSLEYALHIFKSQHYLHFPDFPNSVLNSRKPIKRILIVAAGFGGNAAALVVRNGI
jgi:3-oxoacyl-[acyl-carrier-protein] synthase II